jgi:hypothetical protein
MSWCAHCFTFVHIMVIIFMTFLSLFLLPLFLNKSCMCSALYYGVVSQTFSDKG